MGNIHIVMVQIRENHFHYPRIPRMVSLPLPINKHYPDFNAYLVKFKKKVCHRKYFTRSNTRNKRKIKSEKYGLTSFLRLLKK